MRILFSTTAGMGHFGPMTPVARACVVAGHEVLVAAPESFHGEVERAGLAHAPFDDVPAEVMGPVFARLPSMSSEDANRTVVGDIFGRLDAQAALPRVQALVEAWSPDVILRDPCEFGSLASAARAGVPHAEVAIGLGRMRQWAGEELDGPLLELDTMAGVEAGRCGAEMAAEAVLSSVPPSLDLADEWADSNGIAGQWLSPVLRYRDGLAPGRSGTLPNQWGAAGHPLVYVTFGSVTGGLGALATIFRRSLDALSDLPVRVLMTTGQAVDPESLRPWPTNAHVTQWWPQDDVMPLASAVVGHGGFGTTMTAVAAGVPQVVVPLFAFDQEVNAARIAEAGAGIRLDGRLEAPGSLADAVMQVLADESMRGMARALADEIRSLPDVSELVDSIEGLASGRRRR
jgi:UDP:flavonoid glycosyltransferase YjiC (YdhE family)